MSEDTKTTPKKLPDWKQCVLDEKSQLDERREKLTTFLNSEQVTEITADEVDRRQRQLDCMNAYSGILQECIDAW